MFLKNYPCFAQDDSEFVEISIRFDVPGVGGGEIDAVIHGEEIYMPVTHLFNFLKINNRVAGNFDIIEGFFINQETPYRIDKQNNSIQFRNKLYELDSAAIVITESNLYLKGKYLGEIFGLECFFDFRSLSVNIKTRLELPLIREMRQEAMRKNLRRLQGNVKADTTIGRIYPLFRLGTADWSIYSAQQIDGSQNARINLTLGQTIAGGETTISLDYNTDSPFNEKQQHYLWRYVNNESQYLRQVIAGKINSSGISSIFDPVIGVQLTNTPTTFRRSFGSYTISDKTEPGWIVELYVNDILVDHSKADAAGFFKFEVPLVYGNSLIKLRFYGPWGEERSREQSITIPYNFLPLNTLEYTMSAGIVQDSSSSKFSRTEVNYGLSRKMTIGVGYEYLSSVSSNQLMPFINTSFSLASNLLISLDYSHSVRTKGVLSYRLPSNFQLDLSYAKYVVGQKNINVNYLEERKAVISMPIRFKSFLAYNRLTLSQLVMPATNNTSLEYLLSASVFGLSTSVTANALYVGRSDPYIYSNLSLSFRVPAGFTIYSQAQYGFTDKKFLSTKVLLEKRLFKYGFLNISYEQNYKSNIRAAEIGFRYDCSFAQAGFSTRRSAKSTMLTQYARGSVIYDQKSKHFITDKRSNIGRGSITIIPYLDINANGKKDPDEAKAYGLSLRANGGRIRVSKKDTSIRIIGLEAYTNCFIELDKNSFDNITWRLTNSTMNIAVEPNISRLIEVPVRIVGEVSGMVNVEKNGVETGMGRIIVNFFNDDGKYIGRAITEIDGYFSYFGLIQGKYTAKLDISQLERLNYVSAIDSINFNIKSNIEGDFIEGIDFKIIKKEAEPKKVTIEKDRTSKLNLKVDNVCKRKPMLVFKEDRGSKSDSEINQNYYLHPPYFQRSHFVEQCQ